jgi:hypothetical protein
MTLARCLLILDPGSPVSNHSATISKVIISCSIVSHDMRARILENSWHSCTCIGAAVEISDSV